MTSKLEYPYPEPKPLNVQPLGRGRWKVQSSRDADTWYLVKFWSEENLYTCDCPWGTKSNKPDILCKHIREIKAKYSDVCKLCGQKGIYEESFAAPWDKKVKLFLCNQCDDALSVRYNPL